MTWPTELIEEFVRSYNARDLERIGQLLAPEFSIDTPNHGLREGATSYLESIEREWSSYPACRIDVRTVTATRGRAVLEAVWSFTKAVPDQTGPGKPDDLTVVMLPQVGVWNVKDRVFSSARVYWDSLGFRGQLGLPVTDAVLHAQAVSSLTRGTAVTGA